MGLTVYTNSDFYNFSGPYSTTDGLLEQSGVYIITTVNNGVHVVVDVGESHNVRGRIGTHSRKHLWPGHMIDGLYASAFYCAEPHRMLLESQVREAHNPPCGDH